MAEDLNNQNPPVADPANPAPPADPPKEDVVPLTAYEQMKADLHKQKEANRLLKEEADKTKINAMREKQDWEGIAKTKEQEAEDFRQKYEGLSKSLVENAKVTAIKDAARRGGILEQSLADIELLDFPEVTTETTNNGKIFVNGADKAIESLKLKRPHWFGNKPASVNPTTPETLTPGITGTVTKDQLEKLRVEFMKNQQNPVAKKAYSDALYAYKAQNPI